MLAWLWCGFVAGGDHDTLDTFCVCWRCRRQTSRTVRYVGVYIQCYGLRWMRGKIRLGLRTVTDRSAVPGLLDCPAQQLHVVCGLVGLPLAQQ